MITIKWKFQIVKLFIAVVLMGIVLMVLMFMGIMLSFGGVMGNTNSGGHGGLGLPLFISEEMMTAFFEVQEDLGIPVSSGIAQVIAESGFGLYGEHGVSGQGLSRLAHEYNNLFGIKYFPGAPYVSGSVNMSTWEHVGGANITITDGFAIYESVGDSIRHRGHMLLRQPYQTNISPFLNNDIGSYTIEQANDFAHGIWVSGWATDPVYVQKLIGHMEKYNLYRFDNMTLEDYQNQETILGDGTFASPVPPGTVLSSPFGWRQNPTGSGSQFHSGIDLVAPLGTPIYAADDGVVMFSGEGWNGGYGNLIRISHGNEYETRYAHNQTLLAKTGEVVKRGQVIALMGSTGDSTGSHLHFEIRLNGLAIDPLLHIKLN